MQSIRSVSPSPAFAGLRRGFLAAAAILALRASASNITLTQALLDDTNGFVNFAKPTLGSGANAIPNTVQPGDTVYIAAHTRPLLTLVNLQGTAALPITVTNTGGQLIIDYVDPKPTNIGLRLWGAQHVRLRGTAGSGYDYGIQVRRSGVKIEDNNYQQGLVGGTFRNTEDLEISEIEVDSAPFAGIQAKYEKTNAQIPAGYTALLDGFRIHNCYIHDTGGEGFYIGWTSEGHPDVANVQMYDNLMINTGWDAIQLNRSLGTNDIHGNVIVGYGTKSYTYGDGTFYYFQASAFSIGKVKA
ncbi:MAG: hypothetical protein JWQ83_1313, partial [Lacunisphaera sp.]|nr:hypothetical protein [Lacunisphaera sp.]